MTLLTELRGKKLLLVASTGGHLAELDRLVQQIEVDDDSLWITFDSPQSRSVLDGRRHEFIPYIPPRGLVPAMRGVRAFQQILKQEHFDAIVSTGAAIAVSSHVPAQLLRNRTIYVESVSRFEGPSVTGRIMQWLPGVELYAQHSGYAGSRWVHEFSVLDSYEPRTHEEGSPPRSIFVTLGTIKPYRFDSLVDAVKAAITPDTEIVWQLGETTRDDLPGEAFAQMDAASFDAAARSADLIVTHAGVGTTMHFLDAGLPLLIVPRRKSRGEHVDDHQMQIFEEVRQRNLAATAQTHEISPEVLAAAARPRNVSHPDSGT